MDERILRNRRLHLDCCRRRFCRIGRGAAVRLNEPFIRLPFRFDAKRLADEVGQFGAAAWMPHPSGMRGNSAIALISSGGGDNDSFEGEKQPTRHLAQCPYMRQVMGSFDEVLSRSRLMKLDAGAEVGLHVDFNYHWFSRVRIHIPILTNPQVIFCCGEAKLHMGAGECWIFDSWRRHRVINNSTEDRVHLVIDLCGSSRFWKLVEEAESRDLAAIGTAARLLPFDPGKSVALRTERFSSAPVMAPGECAALVEDLIADFSRNPANDPELVRAYGALLRGFAHDWRELWVLHGQEREGFPRYRTLIENTRRQLHPNRRALTTASNNIGVNAVFSQRILNAALAQDAGHAAGPS